MSGGGLRLGSLCSGYGGLDMAVEEVFGTTTAWVSDIDKGACKILAHRFPDVPNLGDMTAVDWSQVEPVDVLCGGTPCQDLSHAGKRAGMTEGTRSNLWVAMREAIAALRPSLVVWENVRGAYSAEADSALVNDPRLLADTRRRDGEPVLRALGRVLGDLSDLGYDASWHGLRAADVGAPHGRFRVFVIATDTQGNAGRIEHRDGRFATDVERGGRDGRAPLSRRGAVGGTTTQGPGEGALLPTPVADNSRGLPSSGTDYASLPNTVCSLLPTPEAARAGGTPERHLERKLEADGSVRTAVTNLDVLAAGSSTDWGQYAAAIAHWESLTRPAPSPTEPGPKSPRLAAPFSEWMMGLPAGWVTDVPGITRNEALKALGNGVVPQQSAAALRTMLAWDVAA